MKNVLIIDDAALIRSVAQKAATEAGFAAFTARNGQEGLDVLDREEIDIIFCDVNMPVMGGLEMVGEVKKNSKHKFIPIIMLTTESNPDLKAKGKALGVKAWLLKPFKKDKFLIALDKLLGMRV